MATYVVRVSDDEQGYADEYVFGPFRHLATAEAFAEKVSRRIKADGIHATVDRVMPPRLRTLAEAGWFDEPEILDNPYTHNGRG